MRAHWTCSVPSIATPARCCVTMTNLSHDTILKILMACILYLTKDDRSEVDGGMGNPDKIVQNLFPEGNSFPLFKVSSVSVLTVSEVLITERLVSRQGPCAQAKREPPPSLVAISPQELEEFQEFYGSPSVPGKCSNCSIFCIQK